MKPSDYRHVRKKLGLSTQPTGLIISGDHDLLDLKTFRGMPIVTTAQAVRIVGGS